MFNVTDELKRGIQLQEAGDLIQAEAIYRQVLDAEPRELNALFRLAVLCQLQGRAAEAAPLYQRLLALQPGSVQAQNNLGLTLATLGRLDEALACCEEAVRLRPDCAEFLNNLGTIQNTRGNLDEAADAFRRALALDGRYLAAWRNLGMLQLKVADRRGVPTSPHPRRADDVHLDEAVRCLRAALALQPANVLVLNALGLALFSLGQSVEAGDCFHRALSLRPDDAEAGFNLARVWMTLKKWPEAASCLRHVLAHHPDDARVLAALGHIFSCHLPNHAEAQGYFQRLLAVSPNDTKARLMIEALSGAAQPSQLPADLMVAQYNASADEWDQVVLQRGDRSQAWLRAALEPGPKHAELAVLDLGCGTGLSGLQFRAWAATLIGVDQSPGMLAKARARGIYDELIEADLLTALHERPDRFDLIIASDVLLLLGDLGPLFHAVQRALRPGGRFAFTVDTLEGEGEGDYRLTVWLQYAHSRAYLARLAAQTRMEVVSAREVVHARDDGGSAPGLVVVLQRST